MRRKLTEATAARKSRPLAVEEPHWFDIDYSAPKTGDEVRMRLGARDRWLPGAMAPGADFAALNMTGAWLEGANLRGSNMSDARLDRANLRGADLRDCDFTGASLVDASFDKDTKWPRDFDPVGAGAVGPGAKRIGGSVFVRDGEDLRGAELARAKLTGSLVDASLVNATLTGAVLHELDLTGADLSGADLAGADLVEVEAERADFSGASLRGSSLVNANFQGACLRDADVTGANLESAEVSVSTYLVSDWSPETLGIWIRGGAHLVDRDAFPAPVLAAALRDEGGLTLTFDTRLHRFDPTAFDALIAEVLGGETDVTIEERSNIDAEGPSFIRINGSRPEDLVAVTEAFYDRAWRATEAAVEERAVQRAESRGQALLLARLDDLRDRLVRIDANVGILGNEDVRVAISDKAAEIVAGKTRSALRTRFQRIADAVVEDAKKYAKAAGTIDAVAAVAAEVVADVRKAIEDVGVRRLEGKLIEAGLDDEAE